MPSALPDFGTNIKNGHEEKIETQVERVMQREEKPGQRCRLAEWLQMLTNVPTRLQVSPFLMPRSMTHSHCRKNDVDVAESPGRCSLSESLWVIHALNRLDWK